MCCLHFCCRAGFLSSNVISAGVVNFCVEERCFREFDSGMMAIFACSIMNCVASPLFIFQIENISSRYLFQASGF